MPIPEVHKRPGKQRAVAFTEPLPLVSPSDRVNPMILVAEVMRPCVRALAPWTSAVDAAEALANASCGIAPVVEHGRVVGVVNGRDLVQAMAVCGGPIDALKVVEIMNAHPVTLGADWSLSKALEKMAKHGLLQAPVVRRGGKLVGVVCWADMLPHMTARGARWLLQQVADSEAEGFPYAPIR